MITLKCPYNKIKFDLKEGMAQCPYCHEPLNKVHGFEQDISKTLVKEPFEYQKKDNDIDNNKTPLLIKQNFNFCSNLALFSLLLQSIILVLFFIVLLSNSNKLIGYFFISSLLAELLIMNVLLWMVNKYFENFIPSDSLNSSNKFFTILNAISILVFLLMIIFNSNTFIFIFLIIIIASIISFVQIGINISYTTGVFMPKAEALVNSLDSSEKWIRLQGFISISFSIYKMFIEAEEYSENK